jgi:large conductance mechanosensitive channel
MKIPLRDLLKEFKAFAFKGNMLDLAVAVVIGGAFGAVISSLVKDVLMPSIAWLTKLIFGTSDWKSGYESWAPAGVKVGAFLGELVNFLLIAGAVFLVIVKILGMLVKKAAPPPGGPVVRECPMCISEIPIKATRCKFCTSEVRAG